MCRNKNIFPNKEEIYTFSVITLLNLHNFSNRIGGVMVSVIASSAVDRGFETWLGQTKDYKISICCLSAKHAALRRKSKSQNNVSADCCFSELALKYTTKRLGLTQRGHNHWNLQKTKHNFSSTTMFRDENNCFLTWAVSNRLCKP